MARLRDMKHLLILLTGIILVSCNQNKLSENGIKEKFKTHVEYLASDDLEGRETGTEGEVLAADYIAKEFKEMGLTEKGTDGYFQEFEFLAGKTFGENSLSIDGNTFDRGEDYFVMNFSGNGEIEGEIVNVGFGIIADDLDFNDYDSKSELESKVFLMDVSSPDGIHPHSKYKAYHDLRNRVKNAVEKGASAVIFYNPGDLAEDPKMNYSRRMMAVDIPVIFFQSKWEEDYSNCSLKVEMEDELRKGKNVVAYLDKRSAHTIVIGAHYDHLGYGGEGSLHRGEKNMIHNGADDNASGTAILMELGRSLTNSKELDQNILLIAFSGEEKGLLGSSHYAKNPTIDIDEVNCMINMDMVGRLDSTNDLTVFGIGTSPIWDSIADLPEITSGMKIIEKPDGVGPSDHTSFYLENIPVLHLFTGAHKDYHKPGDDSEKINYDGMYSVYNYVLGIISELKGKTLSFTKTKDSENQNAPRFTVTLGVVPDYTFTGQGMRIDGITDGRPAFKAGLQKGDVVIRMGDMDVPDMMGYMTALSMYKKGDSTRVIVQRGAEQVNVQVNF